MSTQPEPSDVLAARELAERVLAHPASRKPSEVRLARAVLAARGAGAPLDVERLAEAMTGVGLWRYWNGTQREFAAAIAAEYERLLADLGKQPDDLTRAGT